LQTSVSHIIATIRHESKFTVVETMSFLPFIQGSHSIILPKFQDGRTFLETQTILHDIFVTRLCLN